jgi:hypothetical protein
MQRTDLRSTVTALSALLIATAACEPGPTGPSTDQAQLVTAFVDLALRAGSSTDGEPVTTPCPAGGQFVVEGTTNWQSEDAVSVVRWDNTIRYEGCRMNGNGTMVTADGQMATAGEARFGEASGQRAPLLFQLSTQVGSMTTMVDGTTRTCSYDVQLAFDPSDGRIHVTGTMCGRIVDFRLPAAP